MTSRQHHDPIDEKVEAIIALLHERHPKLGHEGIAGALKDLKVNVDEIELKAFLEDRNMRPESAGHESWGHVGLDGRFGVASTTMVMVGMGTTDD